MKYCVTRQRARDVIGNTLFGKNDKEFIMKGEIITRCAIYHNAIY